MPLSLSVVVRQQLLGCVGMRIYVLSRLLKL